MKPALLRPLNGTVCSKTSQDGQSIRESTPSRNDYWLGMCVCRWMRPNKATPVWGRWKSVDTEPLSVRESLTKDSTDLRSGCTPQSCLHSLPSRGKNAKRITQLFNNSFTLHWALNRRHFWKVPLYEENTFFCFSCFDFPWLFCFQKSMSSESLYLWWRAMPERGWEISKMSHSLLYLKSCVNYIHCKIFNIPASCFFHGTCVFVNGFEKKKGDKLWYFCTHIILESFESHP